MKMLVCKDICDPLCTFVARGDNDEQVIKLVLEHVKSMHTEEIERKLKTQSNEAIMNDMRKLIADI